MILIRPAHLLMMASLALSSSALADGHSPDLDTPIECDALLIHSDATISKLGQRARDVEHCLELASETARGAYRNTMPYCKNIALTFASPKLIELEGRVVLNPPPAVQTWEQFALSMGESAAASGCRDGILSALQQMLFTNVQQVRDLFARSELFIEDQFAGVYDLKNLSAGLARELRITSSRTQVRVTAFDGIQTTPNADVTFYQVPITGRMDLDGYLSSVLGRQSAKSSLEFDAEISGRLIPGSLEVVIAGFQIKRVTSLQPSAYSGILEKVLMNILQEAESEVSGGISKQMTYELRKAYDATDPFVFLSSQEF